MTDPNYPRAIGEIEGILGIVGLPPLSEAVQAVKKLKARVTELEAKEQDGRSVDKMEEACAVGQRAYDALQLRVSRAIAALENVNRYEPADDFAYSILVILKGESE